VRRRQKITSAAFPHHRLAARRSLGAAACGARSRNLGPEVPGWPLPGQGLPGQGPYPRPQSAGPQTLH